MGLASLTLAPSVDPSVRLPLWLAPLEVSSALVPDLVDLRSLASMAELSQMMLLGLPILRKLEDLELREAAEVPLSQWVATLSLPAGSLVLVHHRLHLRRHRRPCPNLRGVRMVVVGTIVDC